MTEPTGDPPGTVAAGTLRVDRATGSWWWSDAGYAIHGFAMLRVASNDANVPLRHLGRLIAEALPGLGGDPERLNRFLRDLTAAAHQHAPRDR